MNFKNDTMKKLLFITPLFLVFLACNNGSQKNESLEKLMVKRDSLKTVYHDLGQAIQEVEEAILEMDTTIEKRRLLVSTHTLALRN